MKPYRERLATHHTHAREIRERHGYRDFAEEPEHWRLVRWLYTRAWLSAERPMASLRKSNCLDLKTIWVDRIYDL